MVGQRDVARLAGVSVATVSRSLAGEARVGGAMRARVIAAAEALGYGQRRQPPATGRRLLVHLGIRGIAPADRLWLDAVAAVCRARRIPAVFSRPGERRPAVRAGDGVIARGIADARLLADLASIAPVVVISDAIGDHPAISSIEIDHLDGMRQMLAHLRSLGHERIGLFAGIAGTQRGAERLGAFLAHADGPVIDLGARDGWTRFQRCVRRGVRGWIAGSVPAFDQVLGRLPRLGLRAPEDLSVCGFAGAPPLGRAPTAIFGPYAAIGREAARLALDRRLGDPGVRVLVRCALVPGWSTGEGRSDRSR